MKKILISLIAFSAIASAEVLTETTTDAEGNTFITKTNVVKGDQRVIGESPKVREDQAKSFNSPEFQAMLQEAYKRGYQAGAEQSMRDMTYRLAKFEKWFDGIFNFHRLYLEGKYEPPKIGVLNSPVEVGQDGRYMSVQDKKFVVLEDGYFVSEPKTWKTFLLDGNK
jgi:hypothetical protein